MPSDKQYLTALANALWDVPDRAGIRAFKEKFVELATPYADHYPAIMSFIDWFETQPSYATSPESASEIVTKTLNAIRPDEMRVRAGRKKMVPLVGWLIHFRENDALNLFGQAHIAKTLNLAGIDIRPLANSPRVFRSWGEYAAFRQGKTDDSQPDISLEPNFSLPLDRPEATGVSAYRTALDMRFTNQVTRLIGREAELARLLEFTSSSSPLSWWQISGEAGQGKSRLALHLIDQIHGSRESDGVIWEAGFLRDFSDGCLEKIPAGSLENHTLIVIDYIASADRSRAFGRMLDRFAAAKQSKPARKVRFLVLERQRYYIGSNEPSSTSGWQEDVLQPHLGESAKRALATVYDLKGPLELYDLPAPTLETIANNWATAIHGGPLNPSQLKYVHTSLGIHPSELNHEIPKPQKGPNTRMRHRRPLFAIIAADAACRGDAKVEAAHIEFESTLKAVLDSEARELGVCENNSPISMAEKHPSHRDNQAQNLAILANIVGNLDLNAISRLPNPIRSIFDVSEHGIIETNLMLGRRISRAYAEAADFINCREPDLLAEYQVISWFYKDRFQRDIKQIERIMSAAWRISFSNTAAFLRRVCTDFPHHPTVKYILQKIRYEDLHALVNSGQLNEVIKDLGYAGNLKPATRLFEETYNAVHASDCIERERITQAAINLSYHYSRIHDIRNGKKYYEIAMREAQLIPDLGNKYIKLGKLLVNYTDYFANKWYGSLDSIRKIRTYISQEEVEYQQNAFSGYRLWAINNLSNKLILAGLPSRAKKLIEIERASFDKIDAAVTCSKAIMQIPMRGVSEYSYYIIYEGVCRSIKRNYGYYICKKECAYLSLQYFYACIATNDSVGAVAALNELADFIRVNSSDNTYRDYFVSCMYKFYNSLGDMDERVIASIMGCAVSRIVEIDVIKPDLRLRSYAVWLLQVISMKMRSYSDSVYIMHELEALYRVWRPGKSLSNIDRNLPKEKSGGYSKVGVSEYRSRLQKEGAAMLWRIRLKEFFNVGYYLRLLQAKIAFWISYNELCALVRDLKLRSGQDMRE